MIYLCWGCRTDKDSNKSEPFKTKQMNVICNECVEERMQLYKKCPTCKKSKQIREFIRDGLARRREFAKCTDCGIAGAASYVRRKEKLRIHNELNPTGLSNKYLSTPLIG